MAVMGAQQGLMDSFIAMGWGTPAMQMGSQALQSNIPGGPLPHQMQQVPSDVFMPPSPDVVVEEHVGGGHTKRTAQPHQLLAMLDPVVRKGATPASSQTGASNTAVAAIHADYQLAFELAGLKPKAVQKITDSLALINKLKAAVPHDCVADIIKIFDLKNKPERIDFVIDTLKTIGFDSAADTPLLQEAHGPYADLNIFALLKQMRLDGVKSAEDRQILYD